MVMAKSMLSTSTHYSTPPPVNDREQDEVVKDCARSEVPWSNDGLSLKCVMNKAAAKDGGR